ncbi:MAG: hypothetical protein HYT50_00960, partial [Candidatus Wildermuthbacteria bacterium]|nr:hypothetical protein [Candidatus Wildermuthbacteria bacterium]
MRHILLALLSFLLAFSVACAVPLSRATPTNVPPTPTPTPVPTATRIPAGTIILGESNPEATLREVQKASSD